ncbi:MAG: hypothetical protein RML15_03530 [Bacteroidota bacterium]|nr:hypothetical protein [Candidatus Kapabacteria bacterium]MCX7937585.1 hypothetical protein [Chlorobiota bacterium]MDW8271468.1 hypothetical protein [Bacteroidota bacterium]
MHLIRTFVVIAAMGISLHSFATAQQQGSGSDQSSPQNTILKPTMTLGDVLFAINVLNTVEIKGNEVEAFLDVKNVLVKAAQQAQKDKKGESDPVTIEMNLLTANNFLTLFQRASIPGSAAERFQAVKQALYASASPQQAQQDKKR